MFWILSGLALGVAALASLWPLLVHQQPMKGLALATSAGIFVATYFLYQGVGMPEARDLRVDNSATKTSAEAQVPRNNEADAQPMDDMAALAEGLKQRLDENPDDIEGWVLLARSYKTLEMYPQALEALESAKQLSPHDPLIDVELVEARLFNSNNPQITTAMVSQLESAISRDPSLQKALWLLGIAAAQRGDDENAIKWWEALRQQLEPGSQIEQTISAQLTEARSRLGLESGPGSMPQEVTDPGLEIAISVDLSRKTMEAWPELAEGEVPADFVLYIIARPKGQTGGPPLGARRVEKPVFPVGLILTDDDSMLPQRPISSADEVELQARLSASGQPMASAGDWQSIPTAAEINSAEVVELMIDQLVN